MKSMLTIPGSLAIVKLDDRHYQLTDTSVPSIGLCLGVFPTHAAAESFAAKVASIRARDTTTEPKRETNRTPRFTPRSAPITASSIH